MLHEQPFLLGDAPCIADFAAYHPLWFSRVVNPAMAGILDATPGVLAWMDRMAAIGHGKPSKLTSTEAIAIAAAAEPARLADEAFQDDHGIALGSRVTVAAQSFGTETTEGTLAPPPAPTTRWRAPTSAPGACTCISRASAMCSRK
jgi:hypothetical protein